MSCFDTGGYGCLELLVRAKAGGPKAWIELKEVYGGEKRLQNVEPGYFRRFCFPVKKETAYELILNGCHAGLAYLSESETMMETGIQYLEVSGKEELARCERSGGVYRERYHFTPYKNWMNDPNGLCWFRGYYHLYYQYNPFSQEWDNMYWGHAASRDLIHWKDLPVCLEPQKEILDDPVRIGGAFSGSAVPIGDEKIIFFLTRHLNDKKISRYPVEIQVMTESTDSIRFGPERTIIERDVPKTSCNFRDPKVGRGSDGRWYLVLGSCVDGVPSILYYRSEDMENWTYQGELLRETDAIGIEAIECPDAFLLDGRMVVTASLMRYVHEPMERQQVRYYIGNWENGRFRADTSEELDFGGNIYAVQSFEHQGRRIVVGWAADFWKEHIPEEGGCNGSMTIPRILSVGNGRLAMRPVEEVYSLKNRCIYQGERETVCLPDIAGNAWYAKLEFETSCGFRMCLMKRENSGLYLKYENGELRLISVLEHGKRPDGVVLIREIKKIEIFVDRRMAEVFVNDGEVSGTRIFYGGERGYFRAECWDRNVLAHAEVYTMNSTWT